MSGRISWTCIILPDTFSPFSPAAAQPGWILSHQKISNTQGGFTGTLDEDDLFGFSLAFPGDLDGDRVGDLAAGATGDDDGGVNRGAVRVLFLDGIAAPSPGDMNCDGRLDGGDMDPFFECLGAGGCS